MPRRSSHLSRGGWRKFAHWYTISYSYVFQLAPKAPYVKAQCNKFTRRTCRDPRYSHQLSSSFTFSHTYTHIRIDTRA
jgi:hypothetical protein